MKIGRDRHQLPLPTICGGSVLRISAASLHSGLLCYRSAVGLGHGVLTGNTQKVPGVGNVTSPVLAPTRRNYFCRDDLGRRSAQAHASQFFELLRLAHSPDAVCYTALTISGGTTDEVRNLKQ
jgi:hypothetical protein